MPKSGTARARDNASNRVMSMEQLAPAFWAAVEDCLENFHRFSKSMATEKVTDFRNRLTIISVPTRRRGGEESGHSYDDIIYHAEPWYLACNLAGEDMPLEPNRAAYEAILVKNHLA